MRWTYAGTFHVKFPTSGVKRRPLKLPGGKLFPQRTRAERLANSLKLQQKQENKPVPTETGEKDSEQDTLPAALPAEAENKAPGCTAIHLPLSL